MIMTSFVKVIKVGGGGGGECTSYAYVYIGANLQEKKISGTN